MDLDFLLMSLLRFQATSLPSFVIVIPALIVSIHSLFPQVCRQSLYLSSSRSTFMSHLYFTSEAILFLTFWFLCSI